MIASEISEAVFRATKESGQPDTVAKKLDAWLNALMSGNENIEDRESSRRHLELILNDISVKINNS